MYALGIETSCDETSAAVLTDRFEVLSNVILSQDEVHAPYGGVVPELASRQHIKTIDAIVGEALARAGIELKAIDLFCRDPGTGPYRLPPRRAFVRQGVGLLLQETARRHRPPRGAYRSGLLGKQGYRFSRACPSCLGRTYVALSSGKEALLQAPGQDARRRGRRSPR